MLELIQSKTFWLAVAWAAIVLSFVALWNINRDDVVHQKRVQAEQRRQITFLCESVAAVRLVVGQMKADVQLELARARPAEYARLLARVDALEQARFELANQRPCEEVE